MALHEIGKLKFKISKEGLAFKYGDGAAHRLSFSRGKARQNDDGYEQYPGDDSDYAYDERGGADYYQEDSQEEYDAYDRQNADGYYQDDEAGEYYPDSQDEDGYYQRDQLPPAGPVMEYIENNAWVVLALLVVLPPLGIYLLWRLNRYEFPVRAGISAASAIWFIIAIILIFSGIFGGGKDQSTLPEMTFTTVAPTTAAPVEAGELATTSPEPSVEAGVSPSATPLSGGFDGEGNLLGGDTGEGDAGDGELSYVYSPQTGLYYHKDQNCTMIDTGAQVTRVALEAAQNRNQSPCPLCCGGTVYYATPNGKWYHTDPNCSSGIKNAIQYSKEAAESEGKTACPYCAGGKLEEKDDDDNMTKGEKYLASLTNDKSGLNVYMYANGKYFHTKSSCGDMTDAPKVTLLKALQSGKTGCPDCAAGANKLVYCTSGGSNYHLDPDCRGMKNPSQVTLAAAMVIGKTRCTTCVPSDFYSNNDETAQPLNPPETPASTASSGSGDTPTSEGGSGDTPSSGGDGSTAYVYATKNGKYYHTNPTCSQMKNASKVTLLSMIKEGRPACPVCCASASNTVYVSKGGKYYHSYATCSGMTNAQAGTLAQALAYGYTICPDCWSEGGSPITEEPGESGGGDDGNDGYSGVYVYASENGKYYHTKKSCSKADSDVSKVLLELAIDDGKSACPDCASQAEDKVYATKNGKYYHLDKSCAGSGAVSGTLAKALIHGYTACPICCSDDDTPSSSKKYDPGTSGINVYATANGKYYHTSKSCSSISGTAVKVTLEAALNNNKSACPVCADSANRTVYATKDGKYYHYSSSCAGSSASSGTLDKALAMGFKACPNCVTGDGDDDKKTKYEPGTSGIEVYATADGKYFHVKSRCGSMQNGSKVTLEAALNHGLTACPDCAAAAAKKVYAVQGSGTYHYDASCAGTGAKSGTLAEALALGMKACSKCIGNDDTDPEDPEEDNTDRYAPGDTKVYIDLSGDTDAYLYHSSASCSECGMTDGTAVTLKYALEQGFADCGYCDPPVGISD